MGGSHGGFMTNWIVTQTDRFAAAVAISPVSDWFSQHTTSNIPHFDEIFMAADPYDVQGPCRLKSPALYAGTYKTPVMQTAGVQDDCTLAGQAIQYHRAMQEKGVSSVCVVYPEEGHGVHSWPAYIDYCARILGWFQHFM